MDYIKAFNSRNNETLEKLFVSEALLIGSEKSEIVIGIENIKKLHDHVYQKYPDAEYRIKTVLKSSKYCDILIVNCFGVEEQQKFEKVVSEEQQKFEIRFTFVYDDDHKIVHLHASETVERK